MRLLHVRKLEIREFHDFVPMYAILSHTWLPTGEVTFQDFRRGSDHHSLLPGYEKIKGCCAEAERDDIEWV